jgi:hypothetical protein
MQMAGGDNLAGFSGHPMQENVLTRIFVMFRQVSTMRL